jgi:MFS superfamily sulfate permease-like transporter
MAGDWIAGLSVAGLMLPEAVAYAAIAGLEPQRALLAAIVGALAYALVGRSRFAIVTPTSSSAAILAALLATLPADSAGKTAVAGLVVLLVAGLFLIAAIARLGALAAFISRPVLRGFAVGLALTIILGQGPILTGLTLHEPNLLSLALGLAAGAAHWNPYSLGVGLLALAALLGLRRFPRVPGAVLVLALGVAGSVAFDLPGKGVAVVGRLDLSLAWPAAPALSASDFARLAQFTGPLVLILFAESWGTIRGLALRRGDLVDANRELGALGVANLASALVQGMPVGAGFSAGAASEAAGAVSRATAVIAALGLAVLFPVAGPWIAHLPRPVLSAVVIAALLHALDPAPLVRLWRLGRDQYVALGAALGVLAFGVLNGMLIAIVLSVAALVQRLATPRLVQLGRLGEGHAYVDLARHSDAAAPEDLAIWRPAQPLFFANAERIFQMIATRIDATSTRAVVVSLEESVDLDSTALDALLEFDAAMTRRGLSVRLARVHDHVRDLLTAAGADQLVARSSYSVDDAVQASRQDVRPQGVSP